MIFFSLAYLGSVFASVTKATKGQPVYLICTADDVTQVYHAEWLRVAGADRVPVEQDATRVVHETRAPAGGEFRLNFDILSFTSADQGYYVCSINNGTAEASVILSGPLGKQS